MTRSVSAVVVEIPDWRFKKSLLDLGAQVKAQHEASVAASKRVVEHAMVAGDLLIEAKAQLEHGEWLPWLRDQCGISARTAQRYVRLAENRSVIEAKYDTVSYLTLRAALELLAPPAPVSASAAKGDYSAVLECKFADGNVTRMTTWHGKPGVPDLRRGMPVSQHAYWSRMKQPPHDAIEAHFERDGEVLKKYTADDLKAFRMSPEEIERQRECDRRDADLRRRQDERVQAEVAQRNAKRERWLGGIAAAVEQRREWERRQGDPARMAFWGEVDPFQLRIAAPGDEPVWLSLRTRLPARRYWAERLKREGRMIPEVPEVLIPPRCLSELEMQQWIEDTASYIDCGREYLARHPNTQIRIRGMIGSLCLVLERHLEGEGQRDV
jgi:hypothetical protein